MTFPASPANGDLHNEGGYLYQWLAAGTAWVAVEQLDGVYTHNGTNYVRQPSARVFLRFTGDPAPTGLVRGDIVLTQA